MVSKRMAILVLLLALPLIAFAQNQSGSNQGTMGGQGANQGVQGDNQQGAAAQGSTGIAESNNSGTNFQGISAGIYRLGQELNAPITNRSGDLSGTVQDLLIDNNGGIRFYVVSLAQGANANTQNNQGMSGTAYLVPVEQVRWNAGEGRFTFDLGANDLGKLRTVQGEVASAANQAGGVLNPTAPAVKQGENTGAAAEQGTTGGNIVGGSISYVSVRTLIGSEVVNDQGDSIGRIEDVVVNIPQSRVQYMAVSAAGELGVGERYYALPMRTFLGLNTQTHEAVVGISTEDFRGNAGFQPNGRWPGNADRVLGLPVRSGSSEEPNDRTSNNSNGGPGPVSSEPNTPGTGGPTGP